MIIAQIAGIVQRFEKQKTTALLRPAYNLFLKTVQNLLTGNRSFAIIAVTERLLLL